MLIRERVITEIVATDGSTKKVLSNCVVSEIETENIPPEARKRIIQLLQENTELFKPTSLLCQLVSLVLPPPNPIKKQ